MLFRARRNTEHIGLAGTHRCDVPAAAARPRKALGFRDLNTAPLAVARSRRTVSGWFSFGTQTPRDRSSVSSSSPTDGGSQTESPAVKRPTVSPGSASAGGSLRPPESGSGEPSADPAARPRESRIPLPEGFRQRTPRGPGLDFGGRGPDESPSAPAVCEAPNPTPSSPRPLDGPVDRSTASPTASPPRPRPRIALSDRVAESPVLSADPDPRTLRSQRACAGGRTEPPAAAPGARASRTGGAALRTPARAVG